MTPSGDAPSWRPPEPDGYWIDGPFPGDGAIHDGPLSGISIAVKDNIAIAGRVVGNGNPTFASQTGPAASTAPAVERLVAAGAAIRGRVVLDEFAYSLMGVNVHLGTPRNERWPTAVPGGSSSGCAAAVAAGAVSLGIGTDTGGSIRVPASYCGLVGYRPTHGRIDTTGVTPLSPSFDTIGLLVRAEDVPLLEAAAAALLDAVQGPVEPVHEIVIARDLVALVDPEMAAAVTAAAGRLAAALGVSLSVRDLLPVSVDEIRATFSTIQGFEAWHELGTVVGPVERNSLRLAPDILERFEHAATIAEDDVLAANEVRLTVRRALDDATADGRLIAQPAAAGAPPHRDGTDAAFGEARRNSLGLTAPAGLAGLPVAVVPASPLDAAPLGVAFVGGRNTDEALLAALRAAGRLGPESS